MAAILPDKAQSCSRSLVLLCSLAAMCGMWMGDTIGGEANGSGGNAGEEPVKRVLVPNLVGVEIHAERLSKAGSIKGREEYVLAGLKVVCISELVSKEVRQSSERIGVPAARGAMDGHIAPCEYPLVKVGKTWPVRAIYTATMGAHHPSLTEVARGPSGQTRWRNDLHLVAIYPTKGFVDDAEIALSRVQASGTTAVLSKEFIEAEAPKGTMQASGLKWAQKVPPVAQPVVVTVKSIPGREKRHEYEVALRGAEYLPLGGGIVKIGEQQSEPLSQQSLRVDGDTAFLTVCFADTIDAEQGVTLLWPQIDLAIVCTKAEKKTEAREIDKAANNTAGGKK